MSMGALVLGDSGELYAAGECTTHTFTAQTSPILKRMQNTGAVYWVIYNQQNAAAIFTIT